jgi:Ser-tRNA(Ala) deacylase AlaX
MPKTIDPPMHSAEHILNQAMVRQYGCERCFSAHIERKKSKCDYHFERPLSKQERQSLENEVNQVISADLPVTAGVISVAKARQRYNLSRLPEDAGEFIRIVRIGEYDHCPCIGAHVDSTSEIGTFRITSTTYKDGVLRIRFKLRRPAHS